MDNNHHAKGNAQPFVDGNPGGAGVHRKQKSDKNGNVRRLVLLMLKFFGL